MSPGTAVSSRCVCCTTALLWAGTSPCFWRRTRWRRRSSVGLSGRTVRPELFAALRSGLVFACTPPAAEGGSFIRGEFRSTSRFCCKCLNREKLTRHSAEYSEVGAERHDMVVPIHEEKPVQKLQFYAAASEEVGAKRAEGNELRHF